MANFASLNAAAAETAKLTNGSVDYLIINGVFSDPETGKLVPTQFIGREDELRKDMIESLDVNVLGVAHSINAFLPLVRKSSIKKITAISTGLAVTEETPKSGVANFFTYSTMKAALNMVVAKYSAELKPEGITLLALSPGLVMTKETPRMYDLSVVTKTKLMIYIATPQEMADFAVFRQVIQRTKPDWQGPMMPKESVTHQRKVIEDIKVEDSGSFLSHWGNKTWI
jgi:NAD(P)-dependent dehydrogenase (short-subunit alcohol dehydrogenase family)